MRSSRVHLIDDCVSISMVLDKSRHDVLAYSRIIFRFARSRMSSSIVPFVTRLPMGPQ